MRIPTSNNITSLVHNTGILEVKSVLPPAKELQVLDGQRVYTLPYALANAKPRVYINHPADMRTALALVRDASDLLSPLLEGGHTAIAGRLAGALRRIGRDSRPSARFLWKFAENPPRTFAVHKRILRRRSSGPRSRRQP
jgi:hypothetical protein